MKYGMRERVSGAIILVALAVIFIPMLFDDPPSREAQPEPTLTIEQPINVERKTVEEPTPPASVASSQTFDQSAEKASEDTSSSAAFEAMPMNELPPRKASSEPESRVAEPQTRSDPIAEMARKPQQSEERVEPEELTAQPSDTAASSTPSQGGWAVQVGSFGKPDNASRLEQELEDKGFDAFSKKRDNDLTTVYVGPFTSSEAGEKMRAELKSTINIQGLLIRLEGEE